MWRSVDLNASLPLREPRCSLIKYNKSDKLQQFLASCPQLYGQWLRKCEYECCKIFQK